MRTPDSESASIEREAEHGSFSQQAREETENAARKRVRQAVQVALAGITTFGALDAQQLQAAPAGTSDQASALVEGAEADPERFPALIQAEEFINGIRETIRTEIESDQWTRQQQSYMEAALHEMEEELEKIARELPRSRMNHYQYYKMQLEAEEARLASRHGTTRAVIDDIDFPYPTEIDVDNSEIHPVVREHLLALEQAQIARGALLSASQVAHGDPEDFEAFIRDYRDFTRSKLGYYQHSIEYFYTDIPDYRNIPTVGNDGLRY